MTKMTEGTDQRTHVVVVGGGYAGTLAANHLRQRPDIDITLVNPRQVFVERIRLHQFVADTGTATVDYGSLLADGIRLVVDSADRIDADARRILLQSGAVLDYDYLIYAVGSTGAAPLAVPGAAQFAYSVADLESAQRLRYVLADVPFGAPVAVVGGGLTGIETASELAEQGRPVTLICGGRLGPSLSERGRRKVAKRTARARCERARVRPGHTGGVGCGGARQRRHGAQLCDGVDGRVHRAGSGCTQRPYHRRDGPAAHR